MSSPQQTFEDFKRGRMQSFYGSTYGLLIGYAQRFLGEENAYLAEDCVQEAIVKAYNTRHTFISPFQMKAFLFTCVHNRCISILRKSGTQTKYLAHMPENTVEPEISAAMIEQETIDMLQAAIRELPEKYQQVFDLSFEQGLKNEEAAQLLNISINGFNKRKAKMISLLRDKFKENNLMQILITVLFI